VREHGAARALRRLPCPGSGKISREVRAPAEEELSGDVRQLAAARVKAWDIESSKGVLPVLWDRERAKITRITRADVQGAARIQALVMRDVKRLEDWEEVDERPSLVFPSQSMALVYRNAQQIMRTALGLDAREQLALGNMVPVKQRDSAVRFLEMALSELPDDKSAQLRLAWAREVEELEGE